jgi:UDP-N-acetylglucosamine transferase subunit ALG13
MLDAAVAGRLPIVVPRLAGYAEVVDDHQVAFCRRMAADGRALLAETEDCFHDRLDAALAHPDTVRVNAGVPAIDDTIASVRRLISETVDRRVGFLSLARLREIAVPLHRRQG